MIEEFAYYKSLVYAQAGRILDILKELGVNVRGRLSNVDTMQDTVFIYTQYQHCPTCRLESQMYGFTRAEFEEHPDVLKDKLGAYVDELKKRETEIPFEFMHPAREPVSAEAKTRFTVLRGGKDES